MIVDHSLSSRTDLLSTAGLLFSTLVVEQGLLNGLQLPNISMDLVLFPASSEPKAHRKELPLMSDSLTSPMMLAVIQSRTATQASNSLSISQLVDSPGTHGRSQRVESLGFHVFFSVRIMADLCAQSYPHASVPWPDQGLF